MLTVTDKAAATLKEALEANSSEESQVLRLAPSPEGFGLAMDEERDGDHVVEHDDRKVLVVAEDVAQALDGATVDSVETPEGQRLVIQSPDQPSDGQAPA
ncbi:MAG: hypothetical protein WD939_03660 [Dehalococcoidia bacterium]